MTEMLQSLDDDSILSMPNDLWDQLYSLEQQGMLDEDLSRRFRRLSKKRK